MLLGCELACAALALALLAPAGDWHAAREPARVLLPRLAADQQVADGAAVRVAAE